MLSGGSTSNPWVFNLEIIDYVPGYYMPDIPG